MFLDIVVLNSYITGKFNGKHRINLQIDFFYGMMHSSLSRKLKIYGMFALINNDSGHYQSLMH